MIKKIKHIKQFGIFSNWIESGVTDFARYNLFYGRNGSGKSTLSKLFRCIEKKQLIEPFVKAEFHIDIATDPVSSIDQSFLIEPPIIKVFNKDFIKENTQFEQGTTESIIYLGSDNTTLKKEIEGLKIELSTAQEILNKVIDAHQNSLRKQDDFFIASGKELNAFFSNTIYSQTNYNKNNAFDTWNIIKVLPTLNESVLNSFSFDQKKSFISQNLNKKKITYVIPKIDEALYNKLYDEIRGIIKINPVIKTIDRLKKNADIAAWVQKGISIHKGHQSNNCEFCGKILDDSRLIELDNHFNEEFISLQKAIHDKIEEVKKLFIPNFQISTSEFYSDYSTYVDQCYEDLKHYTTEINNGLQFYLEILGQKYSNPLQVSFRTRNISGLHIYNDEVIQINGLIDKHNEKVGDFEDEAKKCKLSMEKHFVAKKAIDEDYKKLLGIIKMQEQEKFDGAAQVHSLNKIISEKEIQLQSDTIAIESINQNLHAFLGNDEISLKRNSSGGYLLIRHGETALNLSEGEKTAIALIYFFAKIREKDNDLKKTIIVLDDPISSFDSNHLFNASHFIREEFYSDDENNLKTLQVFILTHNFYFFSLIKEWFDQKKLNVYVIKSVKESGKRKAIISNAEYVVKQFSSEYHFIFSEVKKYCDTSDKSYSDTHTIANMSRQLLESFLTFKYGRKKLDGCFNEIQGFNDLQKVRKFVNHYSHRTTHGNNTAGFNDYVFAETETLVPLVLKLIEHVDALHYKSMLARINGS